MSKRITDVSNYLVDISEVIPYVDPKYLNVESETQEPYLLNIKSDIYSIGVLFWQLSSGFRPFNNEDYMDLGMIIKCGKREDIIKNTPIKYSNLYAGKHSLS